MLLKGKSVLLFGVYNKYSLGWNIALNMSSHGAKVYLSCRNEKIIKNVQRLLPSSSLISVLKQPCDVQNEMDIKATFQNIDSPLDTIVHSIAYARSIGKPLVDTLSTEFQESNDISAYSLIPMAKYAVPLLEQSSNPSMIALSYIGSTKIVPKYGVMGIAKAALEATSRELAHELGPKNIRVNCISPGPVNTVSARGIPGLSSMIQQAAKGSPMRRNATVDEVGKVASFLASDMASCVTGQTIFADCGAQMMSSTAVIA